MSLCERAHETASGMLPGMAIPSRTGLEHTALKLIDPAYLRKVAAAVAGRISRLNGWCLLGHAAYWDRSVQPCWLSNHLKLPGGSTVQAQPRRTKEGEERGRCGQAGSQEGCSKRDGGGWHVASVDIGIASLALGCSWPRARAAQIEHRRRTEPHSAAGTARSQEKTGASAAAGAQAERTVGGGTVAQFQAPGSAG